MSINSIIVVVSTIINKIFDEDKDVFAKRIEIINDGMIRFDITILDEEGYSFIDDATVENLQSKLNGTLGRWATFSIVKEEPRGEDYLVPTGIMMFYRTKK